MRPSEAGTRAVVLAAGPRAAAGARASPLASAARVRFSSAAPPPPHSATLRAPPGTLRMPSSAARAWRAQAARRENCPAIESETPRIRSSYFTRGFQPGAERGQSAVQPRLHCGKARARDGSNLLQPKVFVEAQHQHLAVRRRKRHQRAIQSLLFFVSACQLIGRSGTWRGRVEGLPLLPVQRAQAELGSLPHAV